MWDEMCLGILDKQKSAFEHSSEKGLWVILYKKKEGKHVIWKWEWKWGQS